VVNYDARLQGSAAAILHELLQHYISAEFGRVKQCADDRLQFELSTILERPGLEAVLVDSMNPPEVHLTLPMACKDVPEITAWPGALQLQIIFYLGTTRTPSTMILEREVFPLLKGFKIPGWIANETFAGEYAESVQAKLNDWCQVQIRRTALQAAYCEALAKLFGCPLERSADSSQISFHFSIASLANFVVVIHFQTGPEFPIQMPNITIQTLMSTRGGDTRTLSASHSGNNHHSLINISPFVLLLPPLLYLPRHNFVFFPLLCLVSPPWITRLHAAARSQ